MEKLVVCIMGQDCEKFISMCLESVKEADAIVYCDGGSDKRFWEEPKWEDKWFESNAWRTIVIENKYDQEDKQMNGKQRNFYLKYIKEKYPGWYCLVLDADEVLDIDGIKKIKEFLSKND